MKYVNGLPVYEKDDPCALHEYSEEMAKKIQEKENTQKEQIENLNKQYTQLNQGLQAANDQIGVLDSLKADRFETEKQFRKIYTDQERQDKEINGLKDSAINITTDKQKSLHIEDSSNMPAKINIFGNSEQETRQGYNLANYNNSSNSTQYNFNIGDIVNGKAYTLYLNIPTANISFNLRYDVQDGEKILEKTNLTGKQCINFTSNKDGILFFNGYNFTSGYKGISEIMLLEGTYSSSNVPEFEKYGASPSPQFPSNIKNVGSNINFLKADLFSTRNINGIDFVNNGDGTYTLNGTATENAFYAKDITLNPGTYTLSGCPKDGQQDKYGLQILGQGAGDFGSGQTFTIKSQTTVTVRMMVWKGVTVSNLIFKPKLEEGNRATSYSPYNCGNIGILKINKNIFDLNAETIKNNNYGELQITNDQIFFKSTEKEYGTICKIGWVLELADTVKDIYISTQNITRPYNNNAGIFYKFVDEKPSNLNSVTDFTGITNTVNASQIKITPTTKYLIIMLQSQYVTSSGKIEDRTITIDKLMVSYSSDLDYKEHEEDKIVFPLEEGQRLMLGDYPGEDEKIHHVRKQISLDETKDWKQSSVISSVFYLDLEENITQDTTKFSLICNQYVYGGILEDTVSNAKNNEIYGFISNSTLLKRIVLRNDNFTDLQSFKNSLSEQKGIPLILEFNLAEEETEDFTEEQKTAFEQLQNCDMYKPITNITTEDNMALIEAQYIADTKTYIDNKYNNLAQQIINQIAGGN